MSSNLPIPAEFTEIANICVAKEGIIGGRSCLTVDARELHAGLGVGRDLSTWIEGRIKKYGFREGVDFEILLAKSGEQVAADELSPKTGEKSKMGRPTQDRRLTLDMAKELSMVENNDLGRLARRYFIWREQQSIASQPSVSVAEIERRMMSALGGMVKGIINKAIKESVSPVFENLRVTHKTGTSAVTDRTAKEWLEHYHCVSKGRGKLVRRVGNALRLLAIKDGVPLLKCARTGTWLFPYSLAIPFMETQGKAWIRLHNASVTVGQHALSIPPSKSSPANFQKQPEPAS